MSQEEIINLKSKKIDLLRKTLTTTRETTRDTRIIPLNVTAFAILKRRRKVNSVSGHVFFKGANKRVDRWKLKNSFSMAVREAGNEKLRFHDLRHTFAKRTYTKCSGYLQDINTARS